MTCPSYIGNKCSSWVNFYLKTVFFPKHHMVLHPDSAFVEKDHGGTKRKRERERENIKEGNNCLAGFFQGQR
jgi:hypothetical protein